MYIEIKPYRCINEEKNKTGYMVQICNTYHNENKEEMLDNLIIDLETLKSKLEEERYKKLTLKR